MIFIFNSHQSIFNVAVKFSKIIYNNINLSQVFYVEELLEMFEVRISKLH